MFGAERETDFRRAFGILIGYVDVTGSVKRSWKRTTKKIIKVGIYLFIYTIRDCCSMERRGRLPTYFRRTPVHDAQADQQRYIAAFYRKHCTRTTETLKNHFINDNIIGDLPTGNNHHHQRPCRWRELKIYLERP